MSSTKISIIIPVYNVEKYLRRCLNSIKNQTFYDWECILVDDGSQDDSGVICDEYSAKDERFKVIHQKNQGVSIARNVGLDNANGEWIGFVDGDDWLDEKTYETAYKIATQNNVDLIQWSVVIENSCTKKKKNIVFESRFFSYADAVTYWYPTMWHKLVSRKLIYDNNLLFPVGIKLSEDRFFALQCYLKSRKSFAIAETFYHYMMNESSASHSMTQEMILQEIDVIKKMENLCNAFNAKSLNDYIYYQKLECKRHILYRLDIVDGDLFRKTFPEMEKRMITDKKIYSFFCLLFLCRLDIISKVLLATKNKLYKVFGL